MGIDDLERRRRLSRRLGVVGLVAVLVGGVTLGLAGLVDGNLWAWFFGLLVIAWAPVAFRVFWRRTAPQDPPET
jgi:hypothetical protein